jgi:hypothetical protein
MMNKQADSKKLQANPERHFAHCVKTYPILLDALENICAGKLDDEEMKEIAREALAKVIGNLVDAQ